MIGGSASWPRAIEARRWNITRLNSAGASVGKRASIQRASAPPPSAKKRTAVPPLIDTFPIGFLASLASDSAHLDQSLVLPKDAAPEPALQNKRPCTVYRPCV